MPPEFECGYQYFKVQIHTQIENSPFRHLYSGI